MFRTRWCKAGAVGELDPIAAVADAGADTDTAGIPWWLHLDPEALRRAAESRVFVAYLRRSLRRDDDDGGDGERQADDGGDGEEGEEEEGEEGFGRDKGAEGGLADKEDVDEGAGRIERTEAPEGRGDAEDEGGGEAGEDAAGGRDDEGPFQHRPRQGQPTSPSPPGFTPTARSVHNQPVAQHHLSRLWCGSWRTSQSRDNYSPGSFHVTGWLA